MIAHMPGVSSKTLAVVVVSELSNAIFAGQAAAAEYLPPELSFQATAVDAITATIRNPNASGVCWAVIGIDQQVHEFTEHDPSGTAGPGETVAPTRSGLAAGEYQLSGFCGKTHNSTGVVKGGHYAVVVGQRHAPTGSFGMQDAAVWSSLDQARGSRARLNSPGAYRSSVRAAVLSACPQAHAGMSNHRGVGLGSVARNRGAARPFGRSEMPECAAAVTSAAAGGLSYGHGRAAACRGPSRASTFGRRPSRACWG